MPAGSEEVDDLCQRRFVGIRIAVDADLEVEMPVGVADGGEDVGIGKHLLLVEIILKSETVIVFVEVVLADMNGLGAGDHLQFVGLQRGARDQTEQQQ